MLNFNSSQIIIAAVFLVFLLNGCGATYQGAPSGGAEVPAAPPPQVMPEPALQSPPPAPEEQKADESAPASSLAPAPEAWEIPAPGEVRVDPDDMDFVERRLSLYESKFEHWLEISDMTMEGALAEEFTARETECVQKLERLLTGYSLLLESMQQSDFAPLDSSATFSLKAMQQLDIAFLESRCGELLAMDISPRYEYMPETAPELSFDAAQEIIASHMTQGNYQGVLFAYGNLIQDFPDKMPNLSTRLNYGLALQYTGQVEAAARHFKNLQESDDLAINPVSLQREIADLLLASGDPAAAESYYSSVILEHEALGVEKTWAEEQLAFLRSANPKSEEMIAYMKLLRQFQTYDYRVEAPRLNEAINGFAMKYAGTPAAVSALRLKTFAVEQLKSWFGRQLVKINGLAEEKKFTEAADILRSMTRYRLPAELQAVLQKTYYEIAQAEMQEMENQRRNQEMELTDQWDAAVNLLDSQRYDIAIPTFEALIGTEYEEKAQLKIQEAANQAAGKMRKEAASLFIKAGKAQDLEQKKMLLLASHKLLTEILVKYPQSDLVDKVEQNIAILEEQIERFDPALLEELRENSAESGGLRPRRKQDKGHDPF